MDLKIILRRICKTFTANLDEDLLKIETNYVINKEIIGKWYKIQNKHDL